VFRLTLISDSKQYKPTLSEIPGQRHNRRYGRHCQKFGMYSGLRAPTCRTNCEQTTLYQLYGAFGGGLAVALR